MADHRSVVSAYLARLQQELHTGHAREHSYRPALKTLFEDLTGLRVVNEPKGSAHGHPDFIFLQGMLPMCWAEAKDIDADLDKVEKSEQMGRYYGYSNLVLTNGLEFRFYKNGAPYGEPAVLAARDGNAVHAHEDAFERFIRQCKDFLADPVDTIRSAEHLAKIMGGKACRLRENVLMMLNPDYKSDPKGKEEIANIMGVLKQQLIHDLSPEQFADIYAQTLVYGLFVARYHDDTPNTFTRSEARDRIPASNHLLQQFFDHIAGANFVLKLSHIVDELCEVFLHADVQALVHGLYQKKGDSHDPIIHFYEDFLKEYDPKLRKNRGVFYTPLPVVRYIVRSVDKILQEHFGLPEGLADRGQVEWEYTQQGKKTKKQIDRVQVLDPAVGTGTFLHEVILNIFERFKGQEGVWEQYVNDHLLPRMHGFELMMASYTIAHLKLSMALGETGVKNLRKRLRVFLTNSLEEAEEKNDNLFSLIGLQGALTEEAQLAAEVKRDYPIMVVLGNPPYSVSSQNASVEIGPDGRKRKTWIGKLLDDYKKDLNEKKLNLDDDYIKFIRFSHYLIEKNGQGVVAMITNNSFLDGITHRRMRQSLLETFDHVYVLDLHGNSKRKEKAPDGGKDENMFDIQQGVGISLFVKTGKKKKGAFGVAHHIDLYGAREEKYDWLNENDVKSTKWKKLEAPAPNFFFVPKDFELQLEYDKGLKLSELFPIWNSGVKTDRDPLFIDMDKTALKRRINTLLSGNFDQQFIAQYRVVNSGSYKIIKKIEDAVFNEKYFAPIQYRIFDQRWTYYDPKVISRPAQKAMKHMVESNLGLIFKRQAKENNYTHFFVSDALIIDGLFAIDPLGREVLAPLYLYPTSGTTDDRTRIPNLNMEILQPVLDKLGIRFWNEEGSGIWHPKNGPIADTDRSGVIGAASCGSRDIFDYIYAVLHSPAYRERYKEFLKIDFPRVPFTSNKDLFWKLVILGREIRLLHLMESPLLKQLITKYPVAGSNEVEKVRYEESMDSASSPSAKVWINGTQYFDGVPKDAWEFPIGGYQPAQKWLKDRKGRTLDSDDILHYQKMIVALKETGKLMGEVDEVIGDNGGFPIV